MRRTGRLLVALAVATLAASGLAATALALGTANDDTYGSSVPFVLEDQAFVVPAPGVFGNDSATAGSSPCLVSPPTTSTHGGTVALGPDGSFTYTPPLDFAGTDSFTYGVSSFTGGETCPVVADDSAVVTLNVTNVNDPPAIAVVGDCASGITVDEDSGTYLGEDVCVSFDPGPANEASEDVAEWITEVIGDVAFDVGPTITAEGFLQFRPAPNDFGTATLHVKARDNGGTANGGRDLSQGDVQVLITVGPRPDAPVATADAFSALRDRTLNIAAPGVLRNDGDVDGDALTASLGSTTTHGVLTLASNGSFSYTPSAGYVGSDAFSYRASDGGLSSQLRVVTLTVTAVPPIATASPAPSVAPSVEPTAEVTPIPFETDSPEPTESEVPATSLGPTAPPTTALPRPSPTAAPAPAAEDEGSVSLPVLLVLVLLGVLLAFAGAAYIPKWLESRRSGGRFDS